MNKIRLFKKENFNNKTSKTDNEYSLNIFIFFQQIPKTLGKNDFFLINV